LSHKSLKISGKGNDKIATYTGGPASAGICWVSFPERTYVRSQPLDYFDGEE